MKKLLLIASALLVGCTFAATAYADAPKFYIGTDYQLTNFDETVSGEDDLNSANIHAGARLTKNVGVEAGVSEALSETIGGADVDLRTYNVDLIGYLPVLPQLDLLGTVGGTYNELEVSGAADEDAFGATVGAGAQYHFTEQVSIRGLVKYDTTDFDTISTEDAVKTTVGLNYTF